MPAAAFDGLHLLQEQTRFLASASANDINSVSFLRLMLAAQQRRTALKNQLHQHVMQPSETSPAVASGWRQSTGGEAMNPQTSSRPSNSLEPTRYSVSSASMALPVPATRTSTHHDPVTSTSNDFDGVPAVASGIRADIPEVEEVVLVPCMHCGRSFAEERIERHLIACEKLSVNVSATISTKNDVFRSAARERQRRESSRSLPGSTLLEVHPSSHDLGSSADLAEFNVSGSGALDAVEQPRTPCPCCHRRFAAEALARHVPICKGRMNKSS